MEGNVQPQETHIPQRQQCGLLHALRVIGCIVWATSLTVASYILQRLGCLASDSGRQCAESELLYV